MQREPELQVGQPILNGRYVVEAFLGRGAFAEVYCVRHQTLPTPRAVKVVSKAIPGVGSTTYEDYRERFRLEAQLGDQLDHPHVIRVYDFEESEGRLYLVTEYAAGGSLAEKLKKGPLPWEEALRITCEVAAGLEALHDQLGIVHRDVKPSNILLDQEGRAKVADLGLAQVPGGLSERSLGLGRPHPGTLLYMSPEQETTTAYLMPSSDIYSLGCVLFEMLTGQLWKHAMLKVEGARELRPELPAWLEEVLQRMLRREPAQEKADAADSSKRYLSMGAVREALEKGLGEGKWETARPRPEFLPQPQKRWPAWGWMLGLVSTLVLVVLLLVWHPWTPGATSTPTFPPTAEIATELPIATQRSSDTPAPTPDATRSRSSIVPSGTPRADWPLEAILHYDAIVWTRVTSDGQEIFQGVVSAGETRTFTATKTLSIRLGNAGGVRVTLNGEDLGVQGSAGQVIDRTWTVKE